MIPTEWKEVRLGDVGGLRGGTGFPLRFQGHKSGAIPFYKVSDMNLPGNEIQMNDSNNWISKSDSQVLGATPFPKGSIVFAKVGAAVFLERKRILTRPSCIDNNMMAIVPDVSCLDVRFLHFALQLVRFSDLVSATALPSINAFGVAAISLAMPPLNEQEVIAEALSDADAAIESLDALIAKKRDVKQAAMQQLLTGRTRLPGFTAEWKEVSFDEVFARVNISNRKLQTSEYSDMGRLPVMDQGQTRIAGFTDRQDIELIPPRDGFVIFGDHTRIVKHVRHPFVAGADGVQILRSCEGFDAEFLSLLLSSSRIPNTGYNRHFKFLKELIFKVPSNLVEQEAIAEALSVMGDESEALTEQVSKLRMVKEGMMQDLLTGKVRLV